MTERVSIALTSMPPSVNTMYVNVRGKGRVRSNDYKRWQQEAGWLLLSQKPKKFQVPVKVTVELNPQSRRAFDLDNRLKGCLDLLVAHGVIPDDKWKWVRKKSVEIVDSGAPCTIIVEALDV